MWQDAITVVREWLEAQDADPDALRHPAPPELADVAQAWGIRRSGADIFVHLRQGDHGGLLQIEAPFLGMPAADQGAFFATLLRLNVEVLVGCAFGIDEDGEIMVVADRPLAGLRVADLDAVVRSVEVAVTQLGPELAAHFGVPFLSEE